MTDTPEQRKNRLAIFAADAVEARSEYQIAAAAVVARTARLKAERLARDAVISLGAPKETVQAALRPKKQALKARMKASKRKKAV
jgi:hypothetical protein